MGTLKNPGTARYRKYFAHLEATIRVWAANPFALSRADFSAIIDKPFTEALKGYKKERKRIKDDGGLKHSSGDKQNKLAEFRTVSSRRSIR